MEKAKTFDEMDLEGMSEEDLDHSVLDEGKVENILNREEIKGQDEDDEVLSYGSDQDEEDRF